VVSLCGCYRAASVTSSEVYGVAAGEEKGRC
jgi:hypothetical protein